LQTIELADDHIERDGGNVNITMNIYVKSVAESRVNFDESDRRGDGE
jgi:hypothetical protein